jgi:hypothetical protein
MNASQDKIDAELEPLFRSDGKWLVPSITTQGPWNPEHQHGSAVAAALSWVIERHPTPVPMRPTRIVFDLLNPVPLQPLRPEMRVIRGGRRVQLLEATLFAGERAVASATALMLRVDPDIALGDQARGPTRATLASRPAETDASAVSFGQRGGFGHGSGFFRAIDFQRVEGVRQTGEPAQAWIRLRVPVIAGEPTTPLMRLAVTGDFTSALAVGLDFSRFIAINPDMTLHIERLPAGDWIGIEAVTNISADGIGTSSGTLHDLHGQVARSHTALYVSTRSPSRS